MTKIFALNNDDQHPTRFLHFRSSNVMNYSEKFTAHNRVDHSYGGTTIAYIPTIIRRKDGSIGVFLEVGQAACHGKDRYVKAKGREIALRNLEARQKNLYDLIYLGEGVVQTPTGKYFVRGDVPVYVNDAGEIYITEAFYSIRHKVAEVLSHMDY